MKKQYKLDEIDCANCARELQDELAKLEGVKSVSVNFMASAALQVGVNLG